MTPEVFQVNFEKIKLIFHLPYYLKTKKAETSSAFYQSFVNRFIQ